MKRSSVLIVREEHLALDLRQQIESLGYDVFVASFSEALQYSSDRRPDVVLMDIGFEGRRDGVETASLLRREHGVPVIFLSARDDDTAFNRARYSDPYGYLLKPVREEDLRRALETTLQRSEGEREIREHERWFSTTLVALSEGVVTFDRDGDILFINSAAKEYAEAFGPACPARHSPLFEMTSDGKPEQFSFADISGRDRTFIRTRSQVFDDFSVLGDVLVLKDISERSENLRQLAEAARMASLGTLAAGVAHEINNPLTVIFANSSFIREQLHESIETHPGLKEEFAELLELESEIQEAAESIRSIVSGMMVLSHPGRGGASLTSVVDAVAKAVKSSRYEVQNRATLLTDVQADLPKIAIDPGKLTQVLVNLIANASQAMSSGDCTTNTIQVRAQLNDGQVLITVSDNGSGMDAITMNQVFDPFFTTKVVGRGTGLGLSICRAIVVTAGGTMSVESRENAGTTFGISLPLESGPDVDTISSPIPNPKVLIIDNDSIVQRMVVQTLHKYDVVVCETYDAALEMIQHGGRFDAILIDLNLGVSSFAFYDKIAAIDQTLAGHVVFAAGGGLGAAAEQRLRELPNFSLRKPYDIRNLREVMSLAVR